MHALFDLPSQEEKERIEREWHALWKTERDKIGSQEKLREVLIRISRWEGVNEEIPGSYSFETPQILYTVYAYFSGKENAIKAVNHEIEHANVYKTLGIPYRFGIALATAGRNRIWSVPLLVPQFPEDWSTEKKQALFHEAAKAVTEQSWGDIEAASAYPYKTE